MGQRVGSVDISLEASTAGLKETARLIKTIESSVDDLARTQTRMSQRAAALLLRQEQAFKRNVQAALSLRQAMKAQGAAASDIAKVTQAINAQGRATIKLGNQTKTIRDKLSQGLISEAQARAQLNAVTRAGTRLNTQFASKINTQKRALREMTKSSNNAKVGVKDLATILRDLESAAVLGLGPLSGLGARIRSIGAIATRSRIAMALFLGTVVGVIASFVKMSTTAITAAKDMERIEAALTAATGSAIGAQREFEFVRKTSKELGIDLRTSAQQYGQLSAASRGTSLAGAGARKIFQAVSTASAGLRLRLDQTARTFLAITQIISKGTVQSEELKNQLGEQLPGAFRLAAESIGVTTKELSKMLEQGEVISEDFLPKFADKLLEVFGGQNLNTDTIVANQNRLNNAIFELGLAFDKAVGTSEIYKGVLKSLTSLVEALSRNMGVLIGLLTALSVGAGTVALVWLLKMVVGFARLGAVTATLKVTMAALIGAWVSAGRKMSVMAVAGARMKTALMGVRGALVGVLVLLKSPLFRAFAIAMTAAALSMAALKGASKGLITVNRELLDSLEARAKQAELEGGILQGNRVLAREEIRERLTGIKAEIKDIQSRIDARTAELGTMDKVQAKASEIFGGLGGMTDIELFKNIGVGLQPETVGEQTQKIVVLREEAELLQQKLSEFDRIPDLQIDGVEEASDEFKDLRKEVLEAIVVMDAQRLAMEQTSVAAIDYQLALGEARNKVKEFEEAAKPGESEKLLKVLNLVGIEADTLEQAFAKLQTRTEASTDAVKEFRKRLEETPKVMRDLTFEIEQLNKETEALQAGPAALDKFKLDSEVETRMERFNKKLSKNGELTSEAKLKLEEYETALRTNAEAQEHFSTISEDASKAIVSGLEDAILSAGKLGVSFEELGNALQRLILRAAVLNPLEDSLTKFFGGVQGSFGGKLPNTFGQLAAGFSELFSSGGGAGGSLFSGGDAISSLGSGIGSVESLGGSGDFLTAGLESLKGFAKGGLFSANNPIVVGEQGPELLIPNVSGAILNREQVANMSSSGGIVINLNIQGVTDADSFRHAEPQIMSSLHNGLALANRRNN